MNIYIYEITISFVYKKIKQYNADCITIMDGKFPSLFLRDKQKDLYSLTHVKYTPIFKTLNKNKILEYKPSNDEIKRSRKNMEKEIKKYIKNFGDIFRYDSYYLGYKLKKNENSDDRTCNIIKKGKIVSVNGGKITGIYIFENFLISQGII